VGVGRVVVGIGARAGVPEEDLERAIEAALAAAEMSAADVGALATIDRRARDPAVRAVARRRGWLLLGYPAGELAAQEVPQPSAAVAAEVGTSSVAEAAALRPGGELVLPKRVFPRVTVAIARGMPGETSDT
jgi:cobalt-precorrin 5A hydrolase